MKARDKALAAGDALVSAVQDLMIAMANLGRAMQRLDDERTQEEARDLVKLTVAGVREKISTFRGYRHLALRVEETKAHLHAQAAMGEIFGLRPLEEHTAALQLPWADYDKVRKIIERHIMASHKGEQPSEDRAVSDLERIEGYADLLAQQVAVLAELRSVNDAEKFARELMWMATIAFHYAEGHPLEAANRDRACRTCKCTFDKPCNPPCHWVEMDLCSECPNTEHL